MSDFVPVDQENRKRITDSLDETLFVEAGAGTGKTSKLVERIINLIRRGRTTIDRIAAITFTEAAAAELRERVRQALEERADDSGLSEAEHNRCIDALGHMESASIQTLHSFAGAMLRESPLEAGLPPAFEVVEEIEADLNFEEQWQSWLDHALESEKIIPSLRRALALGLGIDHLKTIARSFHRNYDLLPKVFPPAPEPTPAAVRKIIDTVAEIRSLLPLALNGPEDPLAEYGERVAGLGDRLKEIEASGADTLPTVANWGKLSFSRGRQADWDNDPLTGMNGCKRLKELLGELEELKNGEVEQARRAALIPLLEALRQFVLEYTARRKSNGKAQFHDLLVWARDLLRDNAAVRGHFQRRFSHILIDEFQDTDPIQADIAFALSREENGNTNDLPDQDTAGMVALVPGKLFVVGDPKQSIYRFRRADLSTMQDVRESMACAPLPLSQNFRSLDPILTWVNYLFRDWIIADEGKTQAAYSDLTARWMPPPADSPMGVHCLGGCLDEKAGVIRQRETQAIARVVGDIKARKWQIREDREGSSLRDARYQDICILLPARTGLQALERALEDAGVPYRIESQSLILSTQEIREMLSCLRAIDSPADQVALIATLRSSAFSCSDAELLEFIDSGGRFDYISPGNASGPVREALDELLSFHRERLWLSIDELVERFIRRRRLVEACFGAVRPREHMRRLQFVIDRARAFAQAGSNSLRSFLDWIERQADENARMVEIPVPECDEDAVRIMTVHGSKGLQFPIVILAGLGGNPKTSAGPVIFNRQEKTVEVNIGGGNGPAFSTTGYEEAKEREKAAELAEDVRLIYVAATRAMDHLVVSLFHKQGNAKSPAAFIHQACQGNAGLWHEIDIDSLAAIPRPGQESFESSIAADDGEDERNAWLALRESVLKKASEPAAVAVTTVTQVAKDESERGEVFYRRGRGGTALGRAVHSVLQSLDLDAGADIDDICKAQAAAESIPEKWKDVVKLVRNGLRTEVVKRAVASGRYYREVFVSAPFEERHIEGYIDVLFEEKDGFVIADYKTDVIDDEDALPQHYEKYKLQAAIYALMVGTITGRQVKQVVLIFLRSGKEIVIGDIESLLPVARVGIRRALSADGVFSPDGAA